jgi:hypothetical protein
MSDHYSFIDEESTEYIIVDNDESILSIELEKGLINIYKQSIPIPPELPPTSILTNTQIKVKTRFNDINHYRKYLKNKRKRNNRKNKHKQVINQS